MTNFLPTVLVNCHHHNAENPLWHSQHERIYWTDIPEGRVFRYQLNDAIADPEGRVFSGIMATNEKQGRLYRIDTDGSIHDLVQGLQVPNGMGFSLDYRYFYLTDSDQHTIFRFDYDRATGALSNQQPLIKTPIDQGIPDGLTVDTDGYIWSARWNRSAVYRYSPAGEKVLRIELPTPKISCVAFGKKDDKTLQGKRINWAYHL